jgi:hypothetical protein
MVDFNDSILKMKENENRKHTYIGNLKYGTVLRLRRLRNSENQIKVDAG